MTENIVYDILIKGGTIYDGTINDPKVADVGIRGDRIADIGQLEGGATRLIDATGLGVTPGFIDVHTHCDLTFQRAGEIREHAQTIPSWKGNWNYLYQGVTTVVTGNCGYGYTDVNHWLEMVDSMQFGTNVYHLVPHGEIRQELLGDDQPDQLTSKQLEAFKGRVEEAMEMGAIGISSGLAYAPGFSAGTEELIALSKVAGRHGGLYVSHIRNESGLINESGEAGVLAAIKEAIEIGDRAELPVNISHLKIVAPIRDTNARQVLDLIEDARRRGLDVTADQYPYEAGSTHFLILLPDEFVAYDGIRESFKTKEGREEIKKAIESVFTYLPPEKILISMYQRNREYEGRTLKEVSEIERREPSESYAEMVCDGEAPSGIFFQQDMKVIKEIMPQDYIITGSDGWTVPKDITRPHPRVYGTFPRKIRKFVLEEKGLSLISAIRSMTSLPAEKFKLQGRGQIEKGNYADIAVIDFDQIMDRATYLEPHQYADGVHYLLVNGVLAIEGSKVTGHGGGKGVKRS
jgi:N-acyl-D-aspartate/D-glutamate deacylase